jgi:hypothetical protein
MLLEQSCWKSCRCCATTLSTRHRTFSFKRHPRRSFDKMCPRWKLFRGRSRPTRAGDTSRGTYAHMHICTYAYMYIYTYVFVYAQSMFVSCILFWNGRGQCCDHYLFWPIFANFRQKLAFILKKQIATILHNFVTLHKLYFY